MSFESQRPARLNLEPGILRMGPTESVVVGQSAMQRKRNRTFCPFPSNLLPLPSSTTIHRRPRGAVVHRPLPGFRPRRRRLHRLRRWESLRLWVGFPLLSSIMSGNQGLSCSVLLWCELLVIDGSVLRWV